MSSEIRGTITLHDGSTSDFTVTSDRGYQQWGADVPRLGRTVLLMEAIEAALIEDTPEESA